MNILPNRLGLVCVLSISCVLNNIAAFNITINNGISASASATNGAVVRIYANVPDQNKVFNSWAGNITGVADRYSPTTSVTVAEADVTLTATYVNAPEQSDCRGQHGQYRRK